MERLESESPMEDTNTRIYISKKIGDFKIDVMEGVHRLSDYCNAGGERYWAESLFYLSFILVRI